MTIELLYGRGTLGVTPPAGCVPTVIAKPAVPVLADSASAVERALARPVGRADIDEWQTQMQLRPMRVGRVRLYTDGLGEEETALTGVNRITDVTSAIAESMARHADARVAFVPEGPYVVPILKSPASPARLLCAGRGPHRDLEAVFRPKAGDGDSNHERITIR